MIFWTWYEWLGVAIGAALGFWIISTALDIGLDWFLSRHVKKEMDQMNKEAELKPPLPRRIPGQHLDDTDE